MSCASYGAERLAAATNLVDGLRRRREIRLDVILLADRRHTCTIEGRDIVAGLMLLLVTALQHAQVLLEQSMVAVRLLLV